MGASIAFASASPLMGSFKESKEAARHIFKVFEHKPVINCFKAGGEIIKNPKGYICFKNVSFYYPSRPDVMVDQSVLK